MQKINYKKLLLKKMIAHDSSLSKFQNLMSQSIMINYEMLKLPNRDENYEVTLNYNILEI